MIRRFVIAAGLLCVACFPSFAACPALPYTFVNGQTADAGQVMANLNALQTCINNSIGTSISGPSTSNIGAVPLWNSTIGTLLKDSGATVFGCAACKGDGVTDDTSALQVAMNAISVGGVMRLAEGKTYKIGNLTIPNGVALDLGQGPGYVNTATHTLQPQGGILLAAGSTITIGQHTRIQHGAIFPFGMTFPQTNISNFAGTAITYSGADSADTVLADLLIAGFATCVDQSAAADRFQWLHVECDGLTGFKVGPSFDTSEADVRCWPWATGITWSYSLTRTGTCFSILGTGRLDNLKVFGLTDFGHSIGLNIQDPSGMCCNIHFGDVWLDAEDYPVKLASLGDSISFAKLRIEMSATNFGPGISATAGAYAISQMYLQGGAGNCIDLNNAQLAFDNAVAHSCGGKFATLATTADRLVINGGILTAITGTPYIGLPAAPAGMPSDAVNITANIDQPLLANASLLPARSFGSAVTATVGISAPSVTIAGTGQTTAELTDSGDMGGMLMLKSDGFAPGAGGGVLFGDNSGHMRHFATIKGGVIDDTGATVGDVDVASRFSTADAALTANLHFDHTGYLQINRAVAAADLAPCAAGLFGALQPVSNATSAVWGDTIAGVGANKVLAFCDGTNWTVVGK